MNLAIYSSTSEQITVEVLKKRVRKSNSVRPRFSGAFGSVYMSYLESHRPARWTGCKRAVESKCISKPPANRRKDIGMFSI